MLTQLSLRLRVFLFFCLLAGGSVTIVAVALFFGYIRVDDPAATDAFVLSAALIGFCHLGLIAGIWLLFDENVAKPIERLASQMRARAHAGVSGDMDLHTARYLGDLAPAAAAVTGKLSSTTLDTAEAVAQATAHLSEEKERLTQLLTEIPMAMVLVNPAHQIVLYDGQAASVLAQITPPRLHASLFDYLERKAVTDAYDKLCRTGLEVEFTVDGADGVQTYSCRMKPLGDAPGYMLVLDDADAHIAPDAARPLVYDFDLLDGAENMSFESRLLKDLVFVVFDTETTGLLPHKDEIVQIGAVRVVKSRIIEGEVLNTLVDPQRPIPPGVDQGPRSQ